MGGLLVWVFLFVFSVCYSLLIFIDFKWDGRKYYNTVQSRQKSQLCVQKLLSFAFFFFLRFLKLYSESIIYSSF